MRSICNTLIDQVNVESRLNDTTNIFSSRVDVTLMWRDACVSQRATRDNVLVIRRSCSRFNGVASVDSSWFARCL